MAHLDGTELRPCWCRGWQWGLSPHTSPWYQQCRWPQPSCTGAPWSIHCHPPCRIGPALGEEEQGGREKGERGSKENILCHTNRGQGYIVSACSHIICAIGHLNADNAMHAIENNSWLWCVWQPIYCMQILYRSRWSTFNSANTLLMAHIPPEDTWESLCTN